MLAVTSLSLAAFMLEQEIYVKPDALDHIARLTVAKKLRVISLLGLLDSILVPVNLSITLASFQKSILHHVFPTFRRLKRADSMYVYHYTLALEPNVLLEHRNTLCSGCPSLRMPMVLLWNLNSRSFVPKPETITTTSKSYVYSHTHSLNETGKSLAGCGFIGCL